MLQRHLAGPHHRHAVCLVVNVGSHLQTCPHTKTPTHRPSVQNSRPQLQPKAFSHSTPPTPSPAYHARFHTPIPAPGHSFSHLSVLLIPPLPPPLAPNPYPSPTPGHSFSHLSVFAYSFPLAIAPQPPPVSNARPQLQPSVCSHSSPHSPPLPPPHPVTPGPIPPPQSNTRPQLPSSVFSHSAPPPPPTGPHTPTPVQHQATASLTSLLSLIPLPRPPPGPIPPPQSSTKPQLHSPVFSHSPPSPAHPRAPYAHPSPTLGHGFTHRSSLTPLPNPLPHPHPDSRLSAILFALIRVSTPVSSRAVPRSVHHASSVSPPTWHASRSTSRRLKRCSDVPASPF